MAKADANGMNNAAGIAYGELIRRQRKAKKMNQEELGALVRVGKNAVGAWEAGRSRPDVGSVPVICEALDLSLEEFFGMPDSSQERIDERIGITPDEKSTLIRRYGALNAYNRQVILRQMSVLKEMQEDVQKPRKVIRLFRNDLAASAGPGEALDAAQGEEVFLFADQISDTADEIIRDNGNSMEPTHNVNRNLFPRKRSLANAYPPIVAVTTAPNTAGTRMVIVFPRNFRYSKDFSVSG